MGLLITIIALIATALLAITIKQRKTIELLSVLVSFFALVQSVIVALRVSAIGIYNPFFFLSVDSLGAIVMLIIGVVGFVTTVYSVEYLRQESARDIIGFTRVKQYFVLLNLFLAAMFLAVTASNPIFAWISIEATTLSTAFLISFYNKPSATEGAWKYLIINSVGLLLGFLGTLLYFTAIGHEGGAQAINWQLLLENAKTLNPMIAKIAFVFVLVGYGTKVGLVPMHTWKPDTYSKAPNPIGALLSGALLPVAFIIVLKFKVITDAVCGPQFSQQLLIAFGVISIAVASLIMLSTKNYKRLLAYSSIENAGIMTLGFALGGFGVFAAVLHMIYHSIVKGMLFFASGNLLLKYNSAKIKNVTGAISVIPITSLLFIAGFLIVTGVPPFGMFITKIQILSIGIKTYPLVIMVTLFFMSLIFIAFLKHVTAMFFGKQPKNIKKGEHGLGLIIPPVTLLVIVIILSFYIPPFLHALINRTVLHY